ncbi:GntP family permease [Balneolaceae bacterium YR4-1]|uniref:GntP family permease n=1 Tax=Halalkalibaculum roseum TaxID=2709311 RepID=A0A6M1SJZ3_9BACT|nr:GntP family permease [Halalkalibaculum roseum]NGP75339.1 GntP family permease [Halalkalibaculum roseum]
MQGYLLSGLLVISVLFIVISTARWKLHPFLALLLAAFGVGLFAGLPGSETVAAITDGFGGTLGSIGIVIAAGTIIGAMLEKSGSTRVIADLVIRGIGKARSALAMSITGAIVSIPVFCDSGFVILSPLNRSLADETKQSLATFAVALSMGLYTTHVFIPPTPGPIAAAGTLEADIGSVILLGICVTIPVILVTYLFANYAGKRIYIDPSETTTAIKEGAGQGEGSVGDEERYMESIKKPSALTALLPILVPMLLIAIGSVASLPSEPFGEGWYVEAINFLGDPNTALIIGVFLAFRTIVPSHRGPKVYGEWVGEGLKSAGTIILITGAGGAFGSVLRATEIGSFLGQILAEWNIGIFLPFLIAAALKTAQGSSTVAIITTASIMLPLLPDAGLAEGLGPVLVTLAIGAGAMTVSHANDSYFWVVSQFSGMDVSQAYRLQTAGSAVAGVTGMITVFILSLFLV